MYQRTSPLLRIRYALHIISFCTILSFFVLLASLYHDPLFNDKLKSSSPNSSRIPLRIYRDTNDDVLLCAIPNVYQCVEPRQCHGEPLFIPEVYRPFISDLKECLVKRKVEFYSGDAPERANKAPLYQVDVLGQSYTASWYGHFPHFATIFPKQVLVAASFLWRNRGESNFLPPPTCQYPGETTIETCEHIDVQAKVLMSKAVLGIPGKWIHELFKMTKITAPQFLHLEKFTSIWEGYRTLIASPVAYDVDQYDRVFTNGGISREPRCTRRILIITRDKKKKLDRTIPPATIQKLTTQLRSVKNLSVEVVVDMGHLSFDQQVRVMQNADVVFSVHGAEMANILFLRRGSYVIEIFPFGYWISNMFRGIRKALRLNYTGLSSAPDPLRFHKCMEHGRKNDPSIVRGNKIFETRSKLYTEAEDEKVRWKAGVFWMAPSWARRCCRAQIIDFNATELAQLILKQAKERCDKANGIVRR